MNVTQPPTKEIVSLTEKFKTSEKIIDAALRVINFILGKLAEHEITSQEVLDDIAKINPNNFQKFKAFFESNIDDQLINRMWTLTRITSSLEVGLPRFTAFAMMQDYRVIRNEKTFEEIDRVPIIIIDFSYTKDRKEKCISLVATSTEVEDFLNMARKRLDTIKSTIEKDKKQ